MARGLFLAKSGGKKSAGHLISAVPDDHVFSRHEETCDYMYVVDFPGMAVDKLNQMKEHAYRPALSPDPEFGSPDSVDRFVITRERKWRLKVEDDKAPVSTTKEATIQSKDINYLIENSKDSEDFLTATTEKELRG